LLLAVIFTAKEKIRLKTLHKKHWLQLILIGLVGGSIPFLLFFKGLSLTSAAQGSFIQKTMFIYAAILAAIFLKEKISKEFLFGAALLIAGNALLLKNLTLAFGRGDLLILIAAFLWATENVISKHTLKELDGKTVAWGRMFFGSLFIFLFLGYIGQISLLTAINLKQLSWILLTSALLFSYVITWYNGLKTIPVSTATAVLMLGSPITTLLSLISGGDVSAREIIAGLVIIFGIIITLTLTKEFRLKWRDYYVRA
jgi:drug/metabolite transporter (DMT)-like permease